MFGKGEIKKAPDRFELGTNIFEINTLTHCAVLLISLIADITLCLTYQLSQSCFYMYIDEQ